MKHFALAVLLAVTAFGACAKKQEITPPPPPLRPEAAPAPPTTKVAKDCDANDGSSELKPFSFDQRSIPESQRLADEGLHDLKSAQSAESDRSTREAYITEAVKAFITSLDADPYNVSATYNLAAAYATIGRAQCSLNLLQRLLQMRAHPSKHADVEAQLDRLLGRGKNGSLDPAFIDLRRDERFRTLIAKMCEGSSDSMGCVYGKS